MSLNADRNFSRAQRRYDNRTDPMLEAMDFDIEPGESIASARKRAKLEAAADEWANREEDRKCRKGHDE